MAGRVIKVSENLYDKLTEVKEKGMYSTYSEVVQVMYYAYITSKPGLQNKLEGVDLLKEKERRE
ncbi:MAG: hypothetical protein ACOC56_03740 [Atribacterota bacterium]